MTDTVINVRGVRKRYRLGEQRSLSYRTLRDVIADSLAGPFRRWRQGSDGQRSNGEVWALDGLNFEVRRGEVVGVIGRNGAGKSTLFKILSRITEPTEGRVEIRGRVGALLEVGTGFHPELTGRENVYLNGAILGMKKAEIDAKFDDIVRFSEFERFMDTPIKYYSSGMHVRLAFGVAAHMEPELLLVDEVLAVGDLAFQKKCLGKIKNIVSEGRTVLFVSHSMANVASLCERAMLLHQGRIIFDGSVDEAIREYMSLVRVQGGEVFWESPERAPGDENVRLRAVRIFQDGHDGPTADVDIARELIVELEYWNQRSDAVLRPSIWLRDKLGNHVLTSSNFRAASLTEDPWDGRAFPAGLYRSRVRIPGHFLNDGQYTITAIVANDRANRHVMQEDVASFHVHDTGEMRKDGHGTWLGAVRPRLAWSTERATP